MGATKEIFARRASAIAPDLSAFLAEFPHLARDLSRPYLSPKEVSAALQACGITLAEISVRRRCRLCAGHPARIATNPAFPGRIYIPRAEVLRLVQLEAVAA